MSYIEPIITPQAYPLIYYLTATDPQINTAAILDALEARYREAEGDNNRRAVHEAMIRYLYPNARPAQSGTTTQSGQSVNKYRVNGVDVTIAGDAPSVRAVLKILEAYPPSGPSFEFSSGVAPIESEGFVDLDKVLCVEKGTTVETVPTFGTIPHPDGKHVVLITPEKEKYSGAGSLIFAYSNGQYFLILFNDAKTNEFSEPGGKIDISGGRSVGPNTLYENSIRETKEETADLIRIQPNAESPKLFVDIESHDTDTKYRVYPYFIHGIDPRDIIDTYNTNLRNITAYTAEFKETNGIAVFNYDVIYKTFESGVSNRINAPDTSGSIKTISARTAKVLSKFIKDPELRKSVASNARPVTVTPGRINQISF